MARGKHWARVERAREYVNGKALRLAKATVAGAILSAEKGDTRAAQWLLEHMATTDEEGREVRPISPTADLQKVPSASGDSNVPRILIGVQLGQDFAQLASGQTTIPALPAAPAETQSVSLPAIDAQILSKSE